MRILLKHSKKFQVLEKWLREAQVLLKDFKEFHVLKKYMRKIASSAQRFIDEISSPREVLEGDYEFYSKAQKDLKNKNNLIAKYREIEIERGRDF